MNCLPEALLFLLSERRSPNVLDAVRNCIQDAMLSPDNLIDYINALENTDHPGKEEFGFTALVQSLSTIKAASDFCGICDSRIFNSSLCHRSF